MRRFGSIYLVTNNTNGKCYVGQTTQTVAARWKAHKGAAGYECPAGILHKAIKKYGKANFTITELVVAFDRTALDAAEDAMIYAHETQAPNGYNLRVGEGGKLHSAETKAKMSATRKGRPVSAELKAKLSVALTGIKFTDEHRANLSAAKKGISAVHFNKAIVDENGTVYPSINHAAEALGTCRQNITGMLKGRQRTANGHTFSYLTKGA